MTPTERSALVYALCFAGAGYIAYQKGYRGTELAVRAFVYGGVSGIGVQSVLFLYETGHVPFLTNPMKDNMTPNAMQFIAQVDAERLYRPLHTSGVTIDRIPDNPMMVEQEE